METDLIKLYCIFSKESIKLMGGNRGKLAAQAGHAYLHAFWDSTNHFPILAKRYRDGERAYKITLFTETTKELCELYDELLALDKFGVTLVRDAGFTVFDGPTVSCIGVGPLPDSLKPESIKNLDVLI